MKLTIPQHSFELYPEDAPNEMTWKDAMEYCTSLGEGWRLPTRAELLYCYENEDFASGVYWSSSENSSYSAWYQAFYTGYQFSNLKYNVNRVRAVRTAKEEV